MKTIIKIVLAILVITALFNAGRAVMGNYQFEDAVHERLLFDPHASDEEIMNFVTKTADQYGVPLDPKDVDIRQVGQDVIVDMSYTEKIALIPGVYAHDWTFKPQASARILVGQRR
jgi:hypothetical protein